jgi:hypothetical protein
MNSLVTSNNVLNATHVHNIVLHVSHNMSAKKTPMRHHKLVVNIALSVLNYTSIR